MKEIPESSPQDAQYWYNRWLAACDQLDEEAQQRIVLHGKIQNLEDYLAEIQSPGWTRGEVIKPSPNEDAYVLWSNIADGPCWVGTREEALDGGIVESRLRRADDRGTSAKGGGHSWDTESLIADQMGLVLRKDLAEYAQLVDGGNKPDAGQHLLAPFEDAPLCRIPKGEMWMGDVSTVPRSWITDEEEHLDSYREGCCLCWVETPDGQRFAAIADKVNEESVVLRRTSAAHENAINLSVRKDQGKASATNAQSKTD